MSVDFHLMYEKTSDAVALIRDGRIVGVNPAALAMFECADAADMLDRELAEFSPPQQAEGVPSAPLLRELAARAHGDGNQRFEWCCVGRAGRQFWTEILMTSVAHEDGALLYTAIRDISARRDEQLSMYLALMADLADRRRTEARTRHLAEHDFLTDLPNRVLLLDRMSLALAAARRNQRMAAILFLDLDRFKYINDTLGHHVGDQLLKEVAARLVKCVRGVDTVSRQGGDEFVVILADIGSIAQAAHVAATIQQAIAQEFVLEPHRLHVSTSIGVSIFPDDGADIETLMKNADLAMYHVKESGRNGYQFFSPEMNAQIVERVAFENDLRRALAERQFTLEYEPEIDIESGLPLAAEALIRWRHPTLGLLLPERFIGVAEDSGLMVRIGQWVLEQACLAARRWHDAGHPLVVGVNLSQTQFLQKNLVDKVRAALEASGLPPALLQLELTEAMLMRHSAGAAATLGALRALGVRLALDDFGTGYTRVGDLKEYPLDKLKIDVSFVGGIGDPDDDAVVHAPVVNAIIAMAHSLGLTVLAEGVESEAQLRFLREHGCDQYQGRHARLNGSLDSLGGLLDG
ncbi:diguanylate cyclase (GGDEF)-like protein [Duganella sp. 1411]|uniref:putative bifunctional diguanylate cyclase/phosphodiesterase n=1 Tax=Duganella sp. 1411 TaxID=2806572 RepID=UPI001B64EC1E|nr:diguanylate cyclase (GGDEF)-like protein [Duganella sp. 1411]